MAVKYIDQYTNRQKYIPRFSIARPSKIYPNSDFWFENKPSGNPGAGANPTIVSYSASVVKIHNATNSIQRF
jgi:hypothetical protein